MPLLKFTKKDKLASRLMPTAWYSANFEGLTDPVKSGAGKSFNMFASFTITNDETYDEKELRICFNTKMEQPSVMGTMAFMPHSMIPSLKAAIDGIPIEEVPDEFDINDSKGNALDIKVEKAIHDGVAINKIVAFLPYGKGKEMEKAAESPF